MRPTLIIFAILLSGCAPQQRLMAPPHYSQERVGRDNMECRYEAMKVEASTPNAVMGVLNGGSAMKMCLQMRGYN